MSRSQRITLLALAVVVAIAGFVVAGIARDDEGGGEESASPPLTQDVTEASTATAPEKAPGADHGDPARSRSTPTKPKRPTVVVRDGEPVGGVMKLTFRKGEQIDFAVRADAADEVHFHGYDIYADLVPDKSARIETKAKFDGRFEVELHGTGTQIAQVEVRP